MRNQRIVATFTTLPDRYDFLIEGIKSMRNQDITVDEIYVTIPFKSKRLNKEYPPIPSEISDICTIIRTNIDYGPIMKVYGALISENDPETIIISCDDDIDYPPNLVRILVSHLDDQPNSCICGSGALIGNGLLFLSVVSTLKTYNWNAYSGPQIDNKGRAVDLIYGYAGVLYLRKFFPSQENMESELFKYTSQDENVFLNDDILLSAYLNKKGVKKYIFYGIPKISCRGKNYDALSYSAMNQWNSLNKAVNYLKTQGFFETMEEVGIEESPVVRTFFALSILLIIFLLCFLVYRFI